jgi:hypothetical protein
MPRKSPPRHIGPSKPRRKRDDFTQADKLAIALLAVPDLITDTELRKHGTSKEIIAAVQFDHIVAEALGGTSAPQNGRPLANATGEHRKKTSEKDIPVIAKAKRLSAAHSEFRARLLKKSVAEPIATKKVSQIKSRGFQKGKIRPMQSRGFEKREEA